MENARSPVFFIFSRLITILIISGICQFPVFIKSQSRQQSHICTFLRLESVSDFYSSFFGGAVVPSSNSFIEQFHRQDHDLGRKVPVRDAAEQQSDSVNGYALPLGIDARQPGEIRNLTAEMVEADDGHVPGNIQPFPGQGQHDGIGDFIPEGYDGGIIHRMLDDGTAVPCPGGNHHAEEYYGWMNQSNCASVSMPFWYLNASWCPS